MTHQPFVLHRHLQITSLLRLILPRRLTPKPATWAHRSLNNTELFVIKT